MLAGAWPRSVAGSMAGQEGFTIQQTPTGTLVEDLGASGDDELPSLARQVGVCRA